MTKISITSTQPGYHSITDLNDPAPRNTFMNFGILHLRATESYNLPPELEKAILPLTGECTLSWKAGDSMEHKEVVRRKSIFDEDPACLHVPSGVAVSIVTGNAEAELAINQTENPRQFAPKFFTPAECRSERRGAGTMRETSTRIVRTIFDQTNRRESNLVLGEVITFPGKWSSYPPHHHPQPEIYHYRFLPEQGFGFAMLGEDVVKVTHRDTVLILNDLSHPQTAAPGYAMYYLWVIRNLDGKPYGTPTFEPEHTWVQKKDAPIWPPGG